MSNAPIEKFFNTNNNIFKNVIGFISYNLYESFTKLKEKIKTTKKTNIIFILNLLLSNITK